MKVKKSLLNFHKFMVVASFFEAIPFEQEQEKQKLPDIPLDMNIDILTNPQSHSTYNVVVELSGNQGKKKLPGYSFFIGSEGIFTIDHQKELQKDSIDQLLAYSAVPMVINSLRGYLSNLTSYSIYGQYLLPSIDIQQLIQQKVGSPQESPSS